MKDLPLGYVVLAIIIVFVSILAIFSQVSPNMIRNLFIESADDVLVENTTEAPESIKDEPPLLFISGEGESGEGIGAKKVIPLPANATAGDLRRAVDKAPDGALIIFSEGGVIDMGAGNMYFLGRALKNTDGTGKKVTIDLNGGVIVSHQKHANGRYYGLSIPTGAEVTILNGSIDINVWGHNALRFQNQFSPAIAIASASSLTLKNVNIRTNGSAVVLGGTNSKLTVDRCIIKGASYAIEANRPQATGVKIDIRDSIIEGSMHAISINCASNATIFDSVITGGGCALFLRAGDVFLSATLLQTTIGDTMYNGTHSNSYKNFTNTTNKDGAPYWGNDLQIPYSVVVLGNYSNDANYSCGVNCTMEGAIIVSPDAVEIPTILCAARLMEQEIELTYDAASDVGSVVIFGEGYDYTANNHDAIINNGLILVIDDPQTSN